MGIRLLRGVYLVKDHTGVVRRVKGSDSIKVQEYVEKKYKVQVVSIDRLPANLKGR